MPSLFSWIAATVLCGGLAFGVWYAIQPEAIPGHSTLTAGGQAVSLSQNQILQSP